MPAADIDDAELSQLLDEWREAPDWVTVAEAEEAAGVSRSAIRAWYRNGEIASHMVGGPHGGQRLVDLDEVMARAARAGRRIGRRRRPEVDVLQLLLERIDELERRIETLEHGR
jgi:excisionase family DNA binding protein